MSNQSEEVQQFMTMTNASFEEATEYIKSFGDLQSAIEGYFAAQSNEVISDTDNEGSRVNSNSGRSIGSVGDRTLGSERSGLQSSSSSSRQPRKVSSNANNSKFMSFSDMVRSNADEEDDEDRPRNTFAGGETSGLEVTDPNDSNSLIKDLLEKAKRGGEKMQNGEFDNGDDSETAANRHFEGRGYRLGSIVDAPSAVVEDNSGPTETNTKQEKVKRQITFWKEGFQVGDGPLYRYDDPQYAHYLKELNQGRAPLKLLDVEYGQDVDVTVFKKLDEPFQPSKRKLGGFLGRGQRLGSPIPGELDEECTQPVKINEPTETKPEFKTVEKTKKEDSEPKGDTSVQIRYATGQREIYRCNSTNTVQSLYDYVKGNTVDQSRAFTLNHAFPVKPIDQFDSTIAEANLKNAVIVQRWV